MNNASTLWLSVTFGLLELATTWWLQATILLAIGLLTAISLRKPVWQSLVFRVTIASVLFSPLLAQLLLLMGCPLLTIDLDSRFLSQQDPTSRIDAASPTESTLSELESVAAPTSLTTLAARQSLTKSADSRTTNATIADVTSTLSQPVANSTAQPEDGVSQFVLGYLANQPSTYGLLALAVWFVGAGVFLSRLFVDLAASRSLRRESGQADEQCVGVCRRVGGYVTTTTRTMGRHQRLWHTQRN